MGIIVDHNSDEFKKALVKFERGLPQVLQQIVKIADTRIGARSVGTYMRNDKAGGRRSPTDSGPLRSTSGALARGVQSRRQGSGGFASNVTTSLTLNSIKFVKEILIPYAAAHEFGGTWTVPVTQRMRSFFWAMWFETKQDIWFNMALTKKTSFTITMPKRAYIEPAIQDEEEEIARQAVDRLLKHVEKSFTI